MTLHMLPLAEPTERDQQERVATATWMPISDMARIYRITLRALRFYENRGLIAPRRQGAVRLYGPDERRRLELVLKGKQLGFTLSEIRDLIAAKRPVDRASLPLTADQIAKQIEHLKRQRLTFDEAIKELQRARRQLDAAN